MESRATDSLPDDMEDRRLADLEKFALKHPNHPIVPQLLKQVQRAEMAECEAEEGESKEGSWYQWLRKEQLQSVGKEKRQYRSGGKKQGSINKWDKESSLELLAASKRFQDSLAELNIRGIRVTSESRWAAIAQNLPNRYGLQPAKYARSCKVHFMNLCRAFRGEQRKNSKGEDAIDPLVRRALEDYFHTGDVHVPFLPTRKGSEVKASVNRGKETVLDIDATNVKMTNLSHERIHHDDRRSAMAKTATISLTKHSKKKPDKVGTPRNIVYSEGIKTTGMENNGGKADKEPHEEELDRPSPKTDSGAILKRWDTASTLQLLAAVRKVGPKAVNRWDVIASQLPNHCQLDHGEYVRSCKEQYRALLRVYTRENMQLDLGHKPLVDEVHAQLERWLLLNATTSKANNFTRRETPYGDRKDMAMERLAVKPAFDRGTREAEVGDRAVSKNWGTTKRIIDPRTDACVKGQASLLYNSDSNQIPVAQSDNVSSWADSIHSENSCRGIETNSRMVGNESAYLKGKQKTTTNISFSGKRIFSSGPQQMEGNKPLDAQKREVERNPAAGTLETCVGLDRGIKKPPLSGKLTLGSDQDDGSSDDSMHPEEDDSGSEDESTRKRKKRLLIMNSILKKRAERNKAFITPIG